MGEGVLKLDLSETFVCSVNGMGMTSNKTFPSVQHESARAFFFFFLLKIYYVFLIS